MVAQNSQEPALPRVKKSVMCRGLQDEQGSVLRADRLMERAKSDSGTGNYSEAGNAACRGCQVHPEVRGGVSLGVRTTPSSEHM